MSESNYKNLDQLEDIPGLRPENDAKQIFSQNLKRLLDSRGKTQSALAADLNYPDMTVSNWINAKTYPRVDKIQQIADYFGVTRATLTEKYTGFDAVQPEVVRLPIIGRMACGEPIDSEENVEGYRYELAQGLPTGDLYIVIAEGHSMEPTIYDGSNVIIKKQSTVDDGQIAAVRFRETGEITLKRIKRQGQTMILVPDNKDFDPIIVTHDNPADIVGRVVRSVRDH